MCIKEMYKLNLSWFERMILGPGLNFHYNLSYLKKYQSLQKWLKYFHLLFYQVKV